MAIQPVPALVLASEFPTNADRTAGVWNAKAQGWANSENAMVTNTRDIAVVTYENAVEAKTAADAAVPAAAQAVAARDAAQISANQSASSADQSVAARNQAVPAAAQALDAAQRAEDAAASIEDGPVTSVNGQTGVVNLGIADVVAPGDIVAYGATKELARAAIDAGYDYERGTLTITSSQTIDRDATFGTATWVLIELWGGGGSGSASIGGMAGDGGCGGHRAVRLIMVSDLPANGSVVIGGGGAGVSRSSGSGFTPGNSGGDTTYAGIVAYGGLGGAAPFTRVVDGSGGRGSVGSLSTPGESSMYGGGGGGGTTGGAGNDAISAGTSQFAGSGGLAGVNAGSGAATGSPGLAPSGGGGGAKAMSTGPAKSGAGARGQARFTWW